MSAPEQTETENASLVQGLSELAKMCEAFSQKGIAHIKAQDEKIARLEAVIENRALKQDDPIQASDCYYMIGEELEVPEGGSVVETCSHLKEIETRLLDMGVKHEIIQHKDDVDAIDDVLEAVSLLFRKANDRS